MSTEIQPVRAGRSALDFAPDSPDKLPSVAPILGGVSVFT